MTKEVTTLQTKGVASGVTAKIEKLEKVIEPQKQVIRHHQRYLESIANKDRGKNLIITGVPEGEEDGREEDVNTTSKNVLLKITPNCENVDGASLEFDAKRLGNDSARKPRPILVTLENKKIRNELCNNARVLKGVEGFDRVYVKRDVHPAIRKEHSRLYKLVKEERQKAENQGCDIVYDVKNGVVKRGDVVIATYDPHF